MKTYFTVLVLVIAALPNTGYASDESQDSLTGVCAVELMHAISKHHMHKNIDEIAYIAKIYKIAMDPGSADKEESADKLHKGHVIFYGYQGHHVASPSEKKCSITFLMNPADINLGGCASYSVEKVVSDCRK